MDLIAKIFVISLAGLMGLALAAGAILVIRDTIRQRGRWGINTKTVRCPDCGEPAPQVRIPKNRRQTLWGGGTCARCGCEYDKWGHAVKQE